MTARADKPKFAMPDGSYPINTCADVSDAAKLAHHSKTYSFAQIKAHVMKAKDALGCPDSVLPDTWDESNSAMPTGEQRESGMSSNFEAEGPWDPDEDGDDDSTAAGDTDHDFWDEDGNPRPEAWLAAGKAMPEVADSGMVDDETDSLPGGPNTGPNQSAGYSGLNSKAPRDNLVRALPNHGSEWRESADSPMGQLYGIFSEFNSWYPVSSAWEGEFIERVAPGAFAQTIKEDRSAMRVLFDHGADPSLGNKPLGQIATLKERDDGPYYEVNLYNTDYNREQIVPLLRGELLSGKTTGSALGSSFRFQVQEDKWNMRPTVSKRNPDGLPERTILKARVFEFGPVCFPANAGATASARSMTDEWLARLISDARFQSEFSARVGDKVADYLLGSIPDDIKAKVVLPAYGGNSNVAALRRRARALLALAG